MSLDFLPQPNDTYVEDISSAAGGTSIISRPNQAWNILIVSDTGATGVIEFSDDTTTYNASHRKLKVYLSSGQYTLPLSFSHGLNLTRGLCATANIAGVDIFVSYD